MTKKRLLIHSIGHQLGSLKGNPRQTPGAKVRIVSDFYLRYAVAYAKAFEERDWDVEIITPTSHEPCLDQWAVPYEHQRWANYDKVLVIYCTSNFFGGEINTAWLPVLDQLQEGTAGDAEVLFFTDDSGNRTSNPFLVYRDRALDKGTIRAIGTKKHRERFDCMLADTKENRKKADDMVEWSVGPNGIKIVMSGGDVSIRKYPNEKYGFSQEPIHFVDHTATFYGALELCYGWDKMDPPAAEDMKYDTLYAGTKRKGRTAIMVPVFEREDLKTLAILRYDREKYELDEDSWPNHTNGEVVPTKESSELHAKCWVVPIVGDVWQKGQQVSSRFWHTLQLPTVGAIHTSYDPERELIQDEWLKGEMYWTTPQDLADLVAKVKADPKYRLKLIEAQRAERPEMDGRVFA